MHYYILCAAHRIESFAYDVFARLGENLNGDVVGNEVVLYQLAQKIVFRFGGGGEADFYLFEADFYQKFEKFHLGFERHRLDKALVAVAQVNRAPYGRPFNCVLFRPVHTPLGGKEILF